MTGSEHMPPLHHCVLITAARIELAQANATRFERVPFSNRVSCQINYQYYLQESNLLRHKPPGSKPGPVSNWVR